jgi:hypothetical protein
LEVDLRLIGGLPFFKPFAGGGWKNVYKLHNPEEFFRAYSETGQLVNDADRKRCNLRCIPRYSIDHAM